jgi:hypothetical protein
MRAARLCGSKGLELSGCRGPARVRCPSRLLARFPVRAVPPPALGQRGELSVSALGRAGALGQRRPESGERVGSGPAAAEQADTRPQLPTGWLSSSPVIMYIILHSLLLVKPARVPTVSTQQFCRSVSKFIFKDNNFFLLKPLPHVEIFDFFFFCYSFFFFSTHKRSIL